MARIIAIAMQKGGVGKTTTAINLAAGLAALDFRVLAIDLDPQGNLTQHVGFDPEKQSPTIYDALKAEVNGQSGKVSSAICQSNEGFDLLPSQPELSLIELSLMNTLSRERVLSTVLEEIEDLYDFVLIDCSPSLISAREGGAYGFINNRNHPPKEAKPRIRGRRYLTDDGGHAHHYDQRNSGRR
jgi:chromosome partitioning protein